MGHQTFLPEVPKAITEGTEGRMCYVMWLFRDTLNLVIFSVSFVYSTTKSTNFW